MSKTLGIEEQNFFKLIERMNKFSEKNQVKATQVFIKEDLWYAIIYYESSNKQEKESLAFTPSPKQRDALKKNGYAEQEIDEMSKEQVTSALDRIFGKTFKGKTK